MILENEQIFLDENLSSKDAVISFIAEKSKLLGITDDENGLYQKLWERENKRYSGTFKQNTQKCVRQNIRNETGW